MKVYNKVDNINNIELLKSFNSRSNSGFDELYRYLYSDLFYYAATLYKEGDVEPQDAVHDAFVKLWCNKKAKFDSLQSLKGFIVITIKNAFSNYVRHKKYVDSYNKQLLDSDELHITYIAEMETVSAISKAIDILPEESAKVFKRFIEGYSIKEIAAEYGKAESTIYNQKNEAIKILKKKLLKDELYIIFLLFN